MFNPKNPTFAQLDDAESVFAQTAWAYFEQNTDPQTGLVPSVRKFKSMTLWDQGGYLLAATSAHKLGIITRNEASGRLLRALGSIAKLLLYRNQLPNKAYNISTLVMTDYANKPAPHGIGWSALDIMRFMTGMLAATQAFPELLPITQVIINKWDLTQLVEAGRFVGWQCAEKPTVDTFKKAELDMNNMRGALG